MYQEFLLNSSGLRYLKLSVILFSTYRKAVFMFRSLVAQPIPVIVLIVLSISFFVLFLLRLVERHISVGKLPLNISSPLAALAATAFVFIAGLMSTDMHGDLSSARQSLFREVSAIQMILLHAESLPEKDRAEVKKQLQEYVTLVASAEWKRMQLDGESRQVRLALGNLLRFIHTVKESDIRDALRSAVGDLLSARMERLRVAADTVPALTWMVLYILGMITIFTISLSHGDHSQWQGVVGVMVTLLTSMILIMLLVYDQPYARPAIVNPGKLIEALQ